jgi:hypothetical protein
MAPAPSGITISLPGIDPHDMERRRLSTATGDMEKRPHFKTAIEHFGNVFQFKLEGKHMVTNLE